MKFFHIKKKKPTQLTTVNPRYRIITVEDPSSTAAEAYRRIKVSLDYSAIDDKLKTILFTSALQGEGKSTSLLNIAACYAEAGKKVLVVDLDFRRPKVHRAFDVENENGITDVLAGKIKLQDAIKHSEKLGFDGLNRGTKVSNPFVMLGCNALSEVMDELSKMYDMILIDCPPLLAVSDTLSFLKKNTVDGVVFVVSQRASDKNASRDALGMLDRNEVHIIGAIVSESTDKFSDNYYYHHYYNSAYTVENGESVDNK